MIRFISLLLLTSTIACTTGAGNSDVIVTLNSDKVLSEDYIGNGVQWDPYTSNYGMDHEVEISDADWEKLYARVDNMAPGFIRLMFNTAQLTNSRGELEPMRYFDDISKILDYCQSRGVSVMFGDWGGEMVDAKAKTINENLIRNGVKYADFLINEKGYSCVKFYNLINEPNGWWSITGGDYSLWASAVKLYNEELIRVGLDSQLGIVGPDIAIWDETETWWIDSCANYSPEAIDLYDIHTYPSKGEVNSGRYSEIVGAYRDRVPEGSRIVMGEIGLKFHEKDPVLDSINKARIAEVEHASQSDSQMFVFDHFYGVDMADVLIQTLNEGYSGSIIWMLDDAMHNNPVDGEDKLKIWGFWNILGEEYFGGEEHERVRPPYYAWSLLCKYIPAGSRVLETLTEGKSGVRVATIENGGAHTIAMINISDSLRTVELRSSQLSKIENLRQYNYIEGDIILDGELLQLPNETNVDMDLEEGYSVELPKNSMILLTNM